MARKPRVQFAGAIYHVITRGDGRRKLFHDAEHYERFTEGLEAEVLRCRWQVISYCWMPNHIHALIRTPEPNLSNGMQHWLSGYANWYAKRNQRTGHLYQGRFKAIQVEDFSYFWPLSRYIHLNPCIGKMPLVKRPQDWKHSSYRNYIYQRDARDWLASELLTESWSAEFGGKSIAGYRRYVEKELGVFQDQPLKAALQGWALGSGKFLQRLISKSKTSGRHAALARKSRSLDPEAVIRMVAKAHDCTPQDYQVFRSDSPGRAMAALLTRELTNVSLAELSRLFKLDYPSSAANLSRKASQQNIEDKTVHRRYLKIKNEILKNQKQD